ncbi:replication-relaxation family protein [Protofrankia symbiont of Coriaria ruscifolia]|uniref:replication-relaxation family protein n=1 Tax=Protofrankia symbiont of Coriaria ruscifolia TaxID=1306542 RepID=UPI001041B8F4|nr:replication-relaxation family protein [Protofrankia symbiont of Coriaria ruscifolia]
MSRSVRRSRRVERDQSSSLASYRGSVGNDGETPAALQLTSRLRVRAAYVAAVAKELSERDRAVIGTVRLLHAVSGAQLERLHFVDLAASSRPVMRRRVLARLVRLRLLVTLERRIGGVRAGSAGLVYALDTAGQRLTADGEGGKATRRPWTPSARFLDHRLAGSELYVQLREAERHRGLELLRFLAEPDSWQQTATLGLLKPDAYAVVASDSVEDAWWIEIDQGTESVPTLRRKLHVYLDAARAGHLGPDGVLPRVLVAVNSEQRREAVEDLISRLPAPASALLCVETQADAAAFILNTLHDQDAADGQ